MGELRDSHGEIYLANGKGNGQTLPPGKNALALDFPAYKIANRSGSGPMAVRDLTLKCGAVGKETWIVDQSEHLIDTFRSADFDNPEPDFEVHDREAGPIAPGDKTGFDVGIRTIGALEHLKVEYVAESDNPKIHITAAPDGTACSSAPSCWAGHGSGARIEAEKDLPAGTYIIRFTARAVGKEHKAEIKLVIDPDVERLRRKRADSLAALKAADPAQPGSPAALVPAVGMVSPEVTFSINADLRKMHALLVLDQSNSMNLDSSCDFMNAAATRFSRLFVEGRDSIGVISFGGGVHLKLPLTDHFLQDAPRTISTIKCAGVTSTGRALEVAQEELARHEDSDAVNIVVLFTDGHPSSLVANLPVKPGECLGPPGGELPALISASVPTASFYPPDPAEKDENYPETAAERGSCLAQQNIYNFAYLPEQDLGGVSLLGNHPLERFTDGLYAGRIRLDLRDNILNAVANEVENEIQNLYTMPNPTLLYVIGFKNRIEGPVSLEYLRSLANDPASSQFDPNKPAGMAILTDDPEAFFPAFQRVREDLVKRAMPARRPTRSVP